MIRPFSFLTVLFFFVTIFATFFSASCWARRDPFLVVAHRGASGYLPEHSAPAVALAHGFGVDFVEPDLILTKDGVLIVVHDVILEETTNVAEIYPKRHRKDGHYYAVDFRWNELKVLELLARSPYLAKDNLNRSSAQKEQPEWRFPKELLVSALKILSFEDYLNLVEGLNRSRNQVVKIIPELKEPEFHSKYGKDIVAAFFKILHRHPYWGADNVVIQCFDPRPLKRIRADKLFSGQLMQLIEQENDGSGIDYVKMLTSEGLSEISTYAEYIGPSLRSLFLMEADGKIKPSEILKLVESSKLKAIPYTHRTDQLPAIFDEERLFKALKNSPAIAGIFSDFSDRAIRYFK
jgi:glycerophosphoryl diester phosphodiesterase